MNPRKTAVFVVGTLAVIVIPLLLHGQADIAESSDSTRITFLPSGELEIVGDIVIDRTGMSGTIAFASRDGVPNRMTLNVDGLLLSSENISVDGRSIRTRAVRVSPGPAVDLLRRIE